ncbi:MAG: hypothetical protein ACJ766_01440 [Thermoleophilaceae bacterium]
MERSERDVKAIRWGAFALIGAIGADLAEELVDPANSDKASKIYDAAANHSGRIAIAAVLLLLSAAFIVPGVWGLVSLLDQRGRGAGRVAAVLALMGAMGHSALGGIYLFWTELAKDGANRGQMVALVKRFNDSGLVAIMAPLLIAFAFTFLVLTIAMYRAHVVSVWALVLVLVGLVVYAAEPLSTLASGAISMACVLGASCLIAAGALRELRNGGVMIPTPGPGSGIPRSPAPGGLPS